MTSVTQQEALENYEENKYDTERHKQETPAKEETRKERHSRTAYGKANTFLLPELGSLFFILACF
jgi:hypothetical protein